jgi:hypothetical protein
MTNQDQGSSDARRALQRGRDFTTQDRDGAPGVAIINEAFARGYLGAAGALGKRLSNFQGATEQKQMCKIVGVVRDNDWQSLNAEVRPFFCASADTDRAPSHDVARPFRDRSRKPDHSGASRDPASRPHPFGFVACYIPAVRAAHADPVSSLKRN